MKNAKQASKFTKGIILLTMFALIGFLLVQAASSYVRTFQSLSAQSFQKEEVSEYIQKTQEYLADFKVQTQEALQRMEQEKERVGPSTVIPSDTLEELKKQLENQKNEEKRYVSTQKELPFSFILSPEWELKEEAQSIKIEAIEKNFDILIRKEEKTNVNRQGQVIHIGSFEGYIQSQSQDIFEKEHDMHIYMPKPNISLYVFGRDISKQEFLSQLKTLLETIRVIYE